MREPTHLVHKYLRSSKRFPHIWCAGCGIGIFMQALIRVIDREGYGKDDIVLISGIGCSGRLPVYVDFNTLHTTREGAHLRHRHKAGQSPAQGDNGNG